ncbi:SAF domain-containing protein [Gordonia sp. NB41Y]|uniref:SAF domain-containing protein n=1 Tax=Gordonia sp. NB41Y TaxID=875808 RepID=UPI0006B1C62B|nr:SAF domain-containing protein [Gordonia sp. NB41Y]KOY49742.1 flagellar basal body P-ring biosynthesis protein FlgA [Gordonia sp. NB41Y]WLP91865.1 SAF domain-containing protein [Gordonia sp. NB41Y]
MDLRPRAGSLSPRLRDRIAHALRPGWTRSVLLRRAVAIVIVVVAVVVGLGGARSTRATSVMVAAHELAPGQILTGSDLRATPIPVDLVPDGALLMAAEADGRTVTGPIRAGEIVTDARLLSARLPMQLTGDPSARLVPVRLDDDAVTTVLRTGDVVDVLTAETSVVARDAVVALVAAPTAAGPTRAAGAAPVLLAMTETAAHRVAAIGLDVPLAVVLH